MLQYVWFQIPGTFAYLLVKGLTPTANARAKVWSRRYLSAMARSRETPARPLRRSKRNRKPRRVHSSEESPPKRKMTEKKKTTEIKTGIRRSARIQNSRKKPRGNALTCQPVSEAAKKPNFVYCEHIKKVNCIRVEKVRPMWSLGSKLLNLLLALAPAGKIYRAPNFACRSIATNTKFLTWQTDKSWQIAGHQLIHNQNKNKITLISKAEI